VSTSVRLSILPVSAPCLVGLWLFAAPALAGENWPQFRGPGSSGVSDGSGLPDQWSATENVVWRTKIAGRAWSSPVVWGDRIFVTSAIQEEGEAEAVKKGLYIGGERKPEGKMYRFAVYCLDWNTGKIVWEKTAGRQVPKHGHHLKNSMASETPATDGQRLYAYFGCLGLFCYDFDGRLLWSRSWGDFATRMNWGTAASPVVHGDRVYVVNDNDEESFMAAVDAKTGDQVWRVPRDEKSNWATPLVWQNEKRTELVTGGSNRVRSYDLDGQILWELGGMSSIHIPTPSATRDRLYLSSGFVADRKRPVMAVRPGASGDISLAADETSNQYVAWCQKQAGPYNPSPILYGEHLYVLNDRGLLGCFDARTGKEVYAKARIDPKANAFTASPWAYEGKLFCLSEDGDTFVIQAGPEFKLLRTNSVGELCMATPAVARRSLILRTESQVLRIGQPAAANP
jgi:outer membrane protein assembly factor BamB